MNDRQHPRQTVLTAHLEGEAVLLEMDRKRYYRMNATGQAIWEALESGEDVDGLVDRLMNEYVVDRHTARAEVERFLQDLADARLTASPDAP